MNTPRQIDFILDASAARICVDSATLRAIERRLPQTATLSVTDVALAIPVSRDVVYAWIDCGAVEAFDMRGKAYVEGRRPDDGKRHNRIGRDSLLEFLRKLAQEGGAHAQKQ